MDKTILNDERISELPNMDLLFHYTSVQVALEHILGRGMLRFSSLLSTNDPHEFASPPHIALGISREVMLENQEFIPAIDDHLGKAMVACFCQSIQTSDRFGWGVSRSRMWSQYADDHSGVCLVFSKEKLLNCIPEKYVEAGMLFHDSVEYKNTFGSRIVRGHNSSPADCIRRLAPQYFFQKREDYKDENEYRFVLFDALDSSGVPVEIPCIDALSAIVLGCKAPRCYNDLFLDIGEKFSIDVLKISWGSDDVYFRPPQPVGNNS